MVNMNDCIGEVDKSMMTGLFEVGQCPSFLQFHNLFLFAAEYSRIQS
jgi:hypothetical protein